LGCPRRLLVGFFAKKRIKTFFYIGGGLICLIFSFCERAFSPKSLSFTKELRTIGIYKLSFSKEGRTPPWKDANAKSSSTPIFFTSERDGDRKLN